MLGTEAPEADHELLARHGLALGTLVSVEGEEGTYKVMGTGTDGSVTVWGGPAGRGSYRAFLPEWLLPLRPNGKRARMPAERRGHRQRWREALGLMPEAVATASADEDSEA